MHYLTCSSYNIGVLSSILVHPGWREMLAQPGPATKGVITGIYYLGTFLSYILVSHPLSDWLGRRYAALSGTLVLCLGALLQASSGGGSALATMVAGRFVCGAGVAVVSTSVPLYQACVCTFSHCEICADNHVVRSRPPPAAGTLSR